VQPLAVVTFTYLIVETVKVEVVQSIALAGEALKVPANISEIAAMPSQRVEKGV
jgi:hypothetical protein